MAKRGDHRDDDGTPMCRICRRDRVRNNNALNYKRNGGKCPFCTRIYEILARKVEQVLPTTMQIKTALANSPSVRCHIKVTDSKFDTDINFVWELALIIAIDTLGESVLIAHNRKQFWVLIKGGRIKL